MVLKKRDAKRLEPKKETTTPCFPTRRGSGSPSSVSFLCRLRRVVVKVIMLTAYKGDGCNCTNKAPNELPVAIRTSRKSYQTEAVEECIEFFKKSASSAMKGS